MRRDDDLIRQLMLDLEEATRHVNQDHPVQGYSRDAVAYHLALILSAGFAEGIGPRYSSMGGDPTIPAVVVIQRLTSTGHDFIAILRNDTVWQHVKTSAAKVGGTLSLEMLKQLGAAYLKQMLGLAPG